MHEAARRWRGSTLHARTAPVAWGYGLYRTGTGARVRLTGDDRHVIEGPFRDVNELIAGFWIWRVESREEAIEWVKRVPNPMAHEFEIEIRQVAEAEDFGDALLPEHRAREERLREQSAKQ